MKIIQLVYALGAGGAERVVVDLANEMLLSVLFWTCRSLNGFHSI